MIATKEQITNGVCKYIENEIAYKTSGLPKFMAYFIMPSIPNKLDELMTKYHSFLEPYIEADGNIDIDELYKVSKSAMQHSIQIEMYGFVFKENDIDMLYRYIVA